MAPNIGQHNQQIVLTTQITCHLIGVHFKWKIHLQQQSGRKIKRKKVQMDKTLRYFFLLFVSADSLLFHHIHEVR